MVEDRIEYTEYHRHHHQHQGLGPLACSIPLKILFVESRFLLVLQRCLPSFNVGCNGYRELIPRGWGDRGVKLTTHPQPVLRVRMIGIIPPLH